MLFLFHYYCIIIMHAATAQQPLRGSSTCSGMDTSAMRGEGLTHVCDITDSGHTIFLDSN